MLHCNIVLYNILCLQRIFLGGNMIALTVIKRWDEDEEEEEVIKDYCFGNFILIFLICLLDQMNY
uniref:Uncharacterized protein n=1 Tax=Onchocerca volvulus TaxID=6282 RepID=A0A8R1XVY4_ONCVO